MARSLCKYVENISAKITVQKIVANVDVQGLQTTTPEEVTNLKWQTQQPRGVNRIYNRVIKNVMLRHKYFLSKWKNLIVIMLPKTDNDNKFPQISTLRVMKGENYFKHFGRPHRRSGCFSRYPIWVVWPLGKVEE